MLLIAKENNPGQVAKTPDVGGTTTTDIATLLPLKLKLEKADHIILDESTLIIAEPTVTVTVEIARKGHGWTLAGADQLQLQKRKLVRAVTGMIISRTMALSRGPRHLAGASTRLPVRTSTVSRIDKPASMDVPKPRATSTTSQMLASTVPVKRRALRYGDQTPKDRGLL